MMRGFSAIGLHRPKFEANVGSVLRLAYNYDSRIVVFNGRRVNVNAEKIHTNTPKAHRHIPTVKVTKGDLLDFVPVGATPVAIEITDNARPLADYVHPERAFYIFGPEDGSIPKTVIDRCRDVVYIPTNRCMNLAATVAVVLYDRQSKRQEGNNV
jgi:tRNA(Leu) C34 or U34 (ribose-2'-O)-methylase TrmL